jgi:hypothetical protein
VHPVSFKPRKLHVLDDHPDATLSIRGRPADPDKAGAPRRISLERHRHHGILSGRRETGRQRPHRALDRGIKYLTAESIRIPVERARAGRSGARVRGGDWRWIRLRVLILWAAEAKSWQAPRGLTSDGRKLRGWGLALGKGRRRPSSNAQKLTSSARQRQGDRHAKGDRLACQALQEPSPHCSYCIGKSRASLDCALLLPRMATSGHRARRDARAGVVSCIDANRS